MTWQSVLKKADYPTTVITLDFETYFDDKYSLKKMSTVEYVCNLQFELTGLGYQCGENDPTFLPPDLIEEFLDYISRDGEDCPQYTIVGQNLKFDCLILKERFGIIPRYTVDTRDLDRIWDARDKHSLEYMAKKWKASKLKGDTQQFKGFHWDNMDEKTRQKFIEYTKTDVEIESFLLRKLLLLVPNPEIELPLAAQTLHLFLNPQIEIDTEMGIELKNQMQLEMLKPLERLRDIGLDCSHEDVSGNIRFVELLNQELPKNEQVPMKAGKNGQIAALAREDEGMRYLLNHKKETVQLLAEARLAVKSWPLHIKRVDNLMNQAKCRGNRIGAPLSYYAGHLGRWGGTEKINLQNLGGSGRGGLDIHPLIGRIRHMLKAPDDFIFGVVDFAQIEARVLAWLAGQDNLVKGFADGKDIYSEFATALFGESVRKPTNSDSIGLSKTLKIRRGFGKDAILGCGYGMGTNKFYARCRTNKDLRPTFDSGEYDWDFVNQLVKTYRAQYAKIPKFWKQVEKAWRFVTKYPKEIVSLQYGLKFRQQGRATFIILPSGRFIRYPHASVNSQGDLLYRWGRNLWGGAITENIVQAVARDILAVNLLRLQDVGYNILFHAHDEVVCLLNESTADLWLDGMDLLMRQPPEWAEGLPIAVETKLIRGYEK